MIRSPLFGRRIHIAGSIDLDPAVASAAEVDAARDFVKVLTAELVALGATFVLPVDRENVRPADGRPICFDWLIWETLDANQLRRPGAAPEPLAIAVQHHKTEAQIPPQHEAMWDRLRNSSGVKIENAAQWNMNAKRMELQARWGDILITIGGGEGVHHLANLYHDAGKPVVPLTFKVCAPYTGSRRLFDFGLASSQTARLFRTDGSLDPQGWINRLNFGRSDNTKRVATVIELLESLRRPTAFGVRLLDPSNPEYPAVQDFFDVVVKPVVEDEYGFKLTVVDGKQPYEYNRVDQEIFEKLHRSGVVVADITGQRPNCFLELGYALGRGLPTLLLGKAGIKHPFDLVSLGGHHWNVTGSVDDRCREFRTHWEAVRSRPPLVKSEPLIP
jgi:hypothetical protein